MPRGKPRYAPEEQFRGKTPIGDEVLRQMRESAPEGPPLTFLERYRARPARVYVDPYRQAADAYYTAMNTLLQAVGPTYTDPVHAAVHAWVKATAKQCMGANQEWYKDALETGNAAKRLLATQPADRADNEPLDALLTELDYQLGAMYDACDAGLPAMAEQHEEQVCDLMERIVQEGRRTR